SRSNLATNKSDVDGIFQLRDASSELSVYPNPASDKFNIVLNLPLTQKTTLKIFDVAGTQIKSEIILSNNQVVNIEQLPNGVYFLFVESDSFIAKHKLVLNKKQTL
ncbi:T9SS type A sorting domain-containing protein, partial [bacterium]|nr:T9SS type A sorting domain-containing protein [bacterium]